MGYFFFWGKKKKNKDVDTSYIAVHVLKIHHWNHFLWWPNWSWLSGFTTWWAGLPYLGSISPGLQPTSYHSRSQQGQLCNWEVLSPWFCCLFARKPNVFPDKYSLLFLRYTLLHCVAAIRWFCSGSTSSIVSTVSQECYVYVTSRMRWGSFQGQLWGFFKKF